MVEIFCWFCSEWVDTIWGNGDYCPTCDSILWDDGDDRNPSVEDIQECRYNQALEHIPYLFTDTSSKITDKTVSVAESMTGGLLGQLFTSESGSSKWFKGGMIVYSEDSKKRLLNISNDALSNYCVNQHCAKEMAKNISIMFQSRFGIGITGFAEEYESNPQGCYYAIYDSKTDDYVCDYITVPEGTDDTEGTNDTKCTNGMNREEFRLKTALLVQDRFSQIKQ